MEQDRKLTIGMFVLALPIVLVAAVSAWVWVGSLVRAVLRVVAP